MAPRALHWKPAALIVLAGAIALTLLAYWIGLQGPFLLDDKSNLGAIPEWLAGRLGLATLLFERGAGAFGRPLSMASLAFNAWLGGYSPYALKLGNLLVHVAVGATIFGFLRQLLRHDARLQARASLLSAFVASLWLLHPLHVSTVLYAVQRMAQMSTLLVLLGLWLYLYMRERLQRGPSLVASAGILVGVPAMTALAFLGKENGILLPLLCAVLELAWFRGPRPWPVRSFHGLFVVLPGLAGVAAVTLSPERFLGSYAGRDFTLSERLLSQGRALCDYLWKLVAPNPPRMGVYTDDFVASTGLVSPPTTMIALLVLIALSFAAWRWRSRLPAVYFGWFFFLGAHALEAGPIPLELYFEHRNYLPSIGILLALVAISAAAGDALARQGLRPGRIGVVLGLGVLTVLAIGTHGRARVWRSEVLIAESSLHAHPTSLRANVAVMTAAVRHGDRQLANAALERLLESPTPRHRSLAHAYRLLLECELDGEGRPADLEAFVTQTPLPLTLYELQPFEPMYRMLAKQSCAPFTDAMFGNALARLGDRASTRVNGGDHWRLRHQAANFLLRARDWHGALAQARLAWRPDAPPPVSMPLVLAQLRTGDLQGAKQTMREVADRTDPSNVKEQENLRWLRAQIAAATSQQEASSK